jgi:hypothetical protein
MHKQCTGCGLHLPLRDYTPSRVCRLGVLPKCRACRRAAGAEYRRAKPWVHRNAVRKWALANPEKQRDASRRHYENNQEYYADKNRAWALANPEKSRQYCRDYNARNPEARRAAWRRHYHQCKHLPIKALRRRVTSRMHAFLSGRRSGFMDLIGCSADTLRTHLELLFAEGMGWHNASEWEIDHFYPLSALGDAPEWIDVAAACNYRNLRPLWRSANRSKRAAVLPEAAQLFSAIKDLIAAGQA